MSDRGDFRIGILGVGSFLPSRVVKNDDLEKVVDTSDVWIRQRTGIQERRILGKGETLLGMAVQASKRALEDAGVAAEEITDIRVGVNTWNRFPSLATQVQKELGITATSASDVSAGCAAFIYAMEDAFNKLRMEYLLYGRKGKALVIGADALSLVTNWKDRGTCILLADGAGAVVIGPSDTNEILAAHTEAQGKFGNLLYLDDLINPESFDASPETFTGTATTPRPYLRMDGRKVFPVAVRTMRDNIREVIAKHNQGNPGDPVELSQVDYFFPHQANQRICTAVADALEVPQDRFYTEGIVKYGNTSAASIPIGYVEKRDRKGDKLVVDVAIGAGFASGAILRRYL